MPGLRGPSALLRLQSDEKLITLTRSGQSAAFEVLCSRYQSRLLSFCRHMLGSREDAEDVLQEVFAAAYNAVLADERDINVRPWLYRIARNRSLNHLRRNSAIGVDSMDVHFAEHGLSTGDRVIRRESFRELLADVQLLPETQRTALLLREMDALSYEQIADAMETTVPSVKSLLVRARISLAEAAEARKLSCAEVRLELGEVAEGLTKLSSPARRHVRGCERCASFRKQLKDNNHALAAMLPVGPLLMLKKLVFAKLGSASAGGAHVAGGAGATVGAGAGAAAGAGATATAGSGIAGGILTAGAGALATKAVAGLAAAAIVTAGVAAADHTTAHHHHLTSAAYASVTPLVTQPRVISERPQPASPGSGRHALSASQARHHQVAKLAKAAVAPATAVAALAPVPKPPAAKPTATPPAASQVTQVTSETTSLAPVGTVKGTTTDPAAAATPSPTGAEAPAPAAPVTGGESPTISTPATTATPETSETSVGATTPSSGEGSTPSDATPTPPSGEASDPDPAAGS